MYLTDLLPTANWINCFTQSQVNCHSNTFNVSEQKRLLNYEFQMQQQTVVLCAILSVHQCCGKVCLKNKAEQWEMAAAVGWSVQEHEAMRAI